MNCFYCLRTKDPGGAQLSLSIDFILCSEGKGALGFCGNFMNRKTKGHSMKRLLTLAALATIASGCNSPNHLEGTLSLNERIEIRTKFLGRDSKHEVPAGSYNTSLALSNSGGSVRIHASDGILSFSAPSIRADQYGKFRLSPEELSQS